MKKITLLLFIISLNLFSQDLKKVDKIIYSYHSITSAEQLAKRIDYDFKTDIEKIRAVYTWLTLNIKYDFSKSGLLTAPQLFFSSSEIDLKYRLKWAENNLVSKTISSKKSVCYGIAITFKKVCDLLKIQNELIKGYSRTLTNEISFIVKNKNHIWNAVKINQEWLFFDATYGLEGNNDSKPDYFYFNIKKEELNLTHYPSKLKWIEYFNQNSLKYFCYQPIYFGEYFKHKIELLQPKLGEIKMNTHKIILEFKNINSTTDVSYRFEEFKYRQKPQITYNNSMAKIAIETPKKNTNLYIYFNGKSALAYRVSK